MTILNKLIGWSLFIILATPGPLQAQERSRYEIEKSCLQAVQGFYNKFVGKGLKYPSAVLSRELHQQLKEDNENKMDAEGHIVGLDFDPIAAGNDICTRYKAARVWRRGDRYFVEVFCFWENKQEENKKMVHELTLNRGRWVIMNIHYYHYEKDKPPEHSDLLSMLKANREERRKKIKVRGQTATLPAWIQYGDMSRAKTRSNNVLDAQMTRKRGNALVISRQKYTVMCAVVNPAAAPAAFAIMRD